MNSLVDGTSSVLPTSTLATCMGRTLWVRLSGMCCSGLGAGARVRLQARTLVEQVRISCLMESGRLWVRGMLLLTSTPTTCTRSGLGSALIAGSTDVVMASI